MNGRLGVAGNFLQLLGDLVQGTSRHVLHQVRDELFELCLTLDQGDSGDVLADLVGKFEAFAVEHRIHQVTVAAGTFKTVNHRQGGLRILLHLRLRRCSHGRVQPPAQYAQPH